MGSAKRYRAVVCLIPAVLAFYMIAISTKPALSNTRDAAFPFFSWALFATTPPWTAATNAVVAHSIDGRPVDRHLIPARSPAHLKTLNQAVAQCGTDRRCDEAVQALLFPIVMKLTNSQDVEFSVGTERVDLRAVRGDIHEIAAGTISKMRYLQRDRTIGRWSTAGGRIPSIEIVAGDPLFESFFRAHLVSDCGSWQRCLVYVKQPCSNSDLDARFFLNVFPQDSRELPESARGRGFEAIRFDAEPKRDASRCTITRPLPGYAIDRLETGQYHPGASRIWTERVVLDEPVAAAPR